MSELSDRQKKMQELLVAMPDTGTRKALEAMSRVDPVIWTMYHRRLRGNPMTFDMERHLKPAALEKARREKSFNRKDFERYLKMLNLRHRPFMIDPLRDDHEHKVYKKGRQIGISELSLTETLCFLDQHPGKKWLYTFPRDAQLQDFSTTRIAPTLDETPRMKALVGTPNQVYTKKIGESHLILRSAWEPNLGEGVDAAGLTLDEKDRMKPGVDIAFKESLSSSEFGWVREVSTPTLPNRGVDASWLISDQRHWMMRCSKCGHKQTVGHLNIKPQMHIEIGATELPDNAYEYICEKSKCGGVIDRIRGEWVAKRPSVQSVRGYHMPQTIAAWISATEVMRKRIKYKFIQLWMNYVLGETSMGDSVMLSDSDFEEASAGYDRIWRRTQDWPIITAGIDWGHKNWVIIEGVNTNGRRYLLNAHMFEDSNARELEGVKQVDSFLAPYEPDCIVADAGFGKDRNAYLLRRYGEDRFFACNYNPSEKGGRTFTPVWSDNKVLVDRTASLKLTCRAVKEREIGFPSLEHEIIKAVAQHLMALAAIKEEDEDGEIVEVMSSSGDDHLAHALLYSELAMDYVTKAGRFQFDFC